MRLIDADALEKVLDEKFQTHYGKSIYQFIHDFFRCVIRLIKKAPTIDPESLRPQGTWIGEADGYADGELVYDVWYCSECNHCIDDGTDNPDLLPNYCPNCGARMEGSGEDA